MPGIFYDKGGIRIEVEALEVEECILFLQNNYARVETGQVPYEVIKKVVDAYKDIKGITDKLLIEKYMGMIGK